MRRSAVPKPCTRSNPDTPHPAMIVGATMLEERLAEGHGSKGGLVELFRRITMEPDVRFGKPCITGTRVDVATVVGAVGAGESIEAVQEAFELTRDQVPQRSALRSLCCRSPPPSRQGGFLSLKILLDQKFPLQIYRRLIDAGHIIALGPAGATRRSDPITAGGRGASRLPHPRQRVRAARRRHCRYGHHFADSPGVAHRHASRVVAEGSGCF